MQMTEWKMLTKHVAGEVMKRFVDFGGKMLVREAKVVPSGRSTLVKSARRSVQLLKTSLMRLLEYRDVSTLSRLRSREEGHSNKARFCVDLVHYG